MSVKRVDLIRYLEKHGFYFLREGGKHTIDATAVQQAVVDLEAV